MSEKKITTSAEIIQQMLDELKINLATFAKECNVLYETLRGIKSGRTNMTANVADKISTRYPQYTRAWLITGQLTQTNSNGDNIGQNNGTINRNTEETLKMLIDSYNEQLRMKDEQIKMLIEKLK